MKVFISWSGNRSRMVAEALRDWLPDVIQAVEPFLSSHDIPKGARWGLELARELEGTSIGIICLTGENLEAPWILFEAGALSKAVEQARICTYLFGLGPENVLPPLSDFQATKAEENETFKMLVSINTALGATRLPMEKLERAFVQWWGVLQERLEKIPAPIEAAKEPSAEEMVRELFRYVRGATAQARTSSEMAERYMKLGAAAAKRDELVEEIANLNRYMSESSVSDGRKEIFQRRLESLKENLVECQKVIGQLDDRRDVRLPPWLASTDST